MRPLTIPATETPNARLMNFHRILFLGLLACLFVPGLNGASSPAERIRERLPEIDALKASGQIGESADGYLAAREALSAEARALVNAENSDRQALYAGIADRTGQTSEAVGIQRALRVFEMSAPGVWLKGPDGQWYRK